jgi:hypothetical protein
MADDLRAAALSVAASLPTGDLTRRSLLRVLAADEGGDEDGKGGKGGKGGGPSNLVKKFLAEIADDTVRNPDTNQMVLLRNLQSRPEGSWGRKEWDDAFEAWKAKEERVKAEEAKKKKEKKDDGGDDKKPKDDKGDKKPKKEPEDPREKWGPKYVKKLEGIHAEREKLEEAVHEAESKQTDVYGEVEAARERAGFKAGDPAAERQKVIDAMEDGVDKRERQNTHDDLTKWEKKEYAKVDQKALDGAKKALEDFDESDDGTFLEAHGSVLEEVQAWDRKQKKKGALRTAALSIAADLPKGNPTRRQILAAVAADRAASDRVAFRSGADLLDTLVDSRGFMGVYRDMKRSDQQSADLLLEIRRVLIDALALTDNQNMALGRLKAVVDNARSWDPALQRNNIFKAANLLGISLPSAMF